jgi:nucleoside-diphosphate-sugar epimerase
MRLLIIGGTSFLGRAAAVEALRRGDTVTIFNRGQSGPDVEGVEALRGDRADDAALEQLAEREFDGVVDTCGFVPRVVGKAARRLAGGAGHYVFVSSISASGTWPGEVTPVRTTATMGCSRPAASARCAKSSVTGRRSRGRGSSSGRTRTSAG